MWIAIGQKTTLLFSSSSFCPAPALLLPCCLQAPAMLLPTHTQLLVSSYHLFAILCYAQLCSCSDPALPLPYSLFFPALALLLAYSCPALGLLLACFWSAPALHLVLPIPVWQPSSSSAPYNFFWHGESRLLWYFYSIDGKQHYSGLKRYAI